MWFMSSRKSSGTETEVPAPKPEQPPPLDTAEKTVQEFLRWGGKFRVERVEKPLLGDVHWEVLCDPYILGIVTLNWHARSGLSRDPYMVSPWKKHSGVGLVKFKTREAAEDMADALYSKWLIKREIVAR